MSAVQRGGHSLVVGFTHCGKPQSQSACSPQLEEEEDDGKMYQQLLELMLYAETWEALRLGLGTFRFRKLGSKLGRCLETPSTPPLSDVLTCRGYKRSDRGRHLILYTGGGVPSRLTGKDKRG